MKVVFIVVHTYETDNKVYVFEDLDKAKAKWEFEITYAWDKKGYYDGKYKYIGNHETVELVKKGIR